jgi:cytochrome P450 family 135
MREALQALPTLQRPATINAAEYWISPERFTRRCGRLGDRFVVPMPATGPWLCLTDPGDIQRVFTADTNVLRFGAALAKTAPHLLLLGPTGLTNVDGPEHTRRRRMQLPAFHRKVLASHEAVMQRKTEEALASLVFGQPVRIHDFMQEIALEVIIAAIFGITEPARAGRLRTATLALIDEASSQRFFLQTVIATARRNGWDRPFPRIRRAVAAIDAVVLEEVSERKRAGEIERDDILGLFLRTPGDHGSPMPDRELCDAMRTLLIGGHETTASTLAWILERAARHPHVVARLNSAALDGDDGYIDAVIKEGMRLRPVFPMTARLAAEPFELPGLTIPAGTMVVPYITLVHRRADLYPDPLAFRPERFLGTRAGTFTWIPFGGGARRCIGASFALIEARVVLRTMLRHAELLPTRERSERIGRRNVTIVPARGGRITLKKLPPAARRTRDGETTAAAAAHA